MTEEANAVEKQFSIQKIYTKDISFETPNSPKVFTEKWEPSVDFNLGTHVLPLENSMYEVALAVTITVKNGDTTAYLVEVNQAGIFFFRRFHRYGNGTDAWQFLPQHFVSLRKRSYFRPRYKRRLSADAFSPGKFRRLILSASTTSATNAWFRNHQLTCPELVERFT